MQVPQNLGRQAAVCPPLTYIFSIAVRPAVSRYGPLSGANREHSGCLKDIVLKSARKLSLVETFVPSESTRPGQISDLIKEFFFSSLFRLFYEFF